MTYSPGSLKLAVVFDLPSASAAVGGSKVTRPFNGPRYFRQRTVSPCGFFVRVLTGSPSSVALTVMLADAVFDIAWLAGSIVTLGALFRPTVPSIVVSFRSMIERGLRLAVTTSGLPRIVSRHTSF